mgnify:CR=1 FL=1
MGDGGDQAAIGGTHPAADVDHLAFGAQQRGAGEEETADQLRVGRGQLRGDPAAKEIIVAGVRETVGAAARALGAAYVKATPPPAEHPSAADPVLLAPRLRALADEAADAGTRLALEPLPWTAVRSIPAGADLARAVGHPAFGLCVDAWHVFRAGTTLDELAASLAPGPAGLVVGVELDDADAEVVGTLFEDTRDHRRYCGEGVFDLPGLVRVLRDAGYDGPWGVEALSAEHRATPLEQGLVRARDAALAVLSRS